jgi:pimeloyl-ACP methyl ester carboxylesterase
MLPRVSGHGLALAYREWNAEAPGEPLVLLHGITGSSADWKRVVAHLPVTQRIIALDARGHGESDWDPEAAYAGDQHFADLACALDGLGIARCNLAGYSMGGGVAMILAAAMPERVAGVAVVDTYPNPEMSGGSRRIAEWIAGYASGGAWFDPAIARHFREQLEAGTAARLDLWPMWEAIDCPTLLVRGALSDVLPGSLAGEMVRRQPRARLASVPGVAHPIPFLAPRVLAEELERFFA